MDDRILAALAAYAKEQTPQAFVALRKAAIASPHYAPYNDNLNDVAELIDRGAYPIADELLRAGMANYLLSPTAHFMAAFTAEKLGDGRRSGMEAAIGRLLLRGILESGDGSRERPFLVTRVKDEYEVLTHFEKTPNGQALFDGAESAPACDRIECADGTVYWFDVSALFAAADRGTAGASAGAPEPARLAVPPTPPEPSASPSQAPWWRRLGRRTAR
jgi:hypothetical protein